MNENPCYYALVNRKIKCNEGILKRVLNICFKKKKKSEIFDLIKISGIPEIVYNKIT